MLGWDPSPTEAPTLGQPECGFGIFQLTKPGNANLQGLLPHDDVLRLMKPAGKFLKDGVQLFQ